MNENKILALKYRPQEFKDLIGQDVMSQIIVNSIKLEKTPNAYLLTGIRGVGKTTTARLIAKSLNCLKNLDSKIKCSPENFCNSCKEIVGSNHMDVIEMDAASKTGIDDIREIIENSKYSPTSAKYKIFIIDEVHMLSKQAFNGLLKTLEEPPPSLKFILATTEVRKIPVTILSRCQRFDLKRLGLEQIFSYLKKIAANENGKITDGSLKILARMSEGSARDAISLLDRALVSQNISDKGEVEEKDVREMLGLADKSKLLYLFREVLEGNEKKALSLLNELINDGLEAKNFLNDILEIIYLFSRKITLGSIEKETLIPEAEINLINEHSKNIDIQDIALFWQLTLKTLDDLKILSNEKLTLEMFVMQLMYLKNIDQNEKNSLSSKKTDSNSSFDSPSKDIRNKQAEIKEANPNIRNQLRSTDQVKTVVEKKTETIIEQKHETINSYKELINLAYRDNELELKYDLERNVSLVSFEKGKIDINFNEKLNKNFIKNLSEKLLNWTGERWIISLSKKTGSKSVFEKNIELKNIKLEKIKKSETVKKFHSIFEDAKFVELKEDQDA
jgi:DNA polymerase III subunit gamma/tau